ncbi:MAG: hypothetical protein FJ100_15600 [Deltaproteobacteria bacterium]|nr:hypothetical protein [Deltaproteobacteria bacterium]
MWLAIAACIALLAACGAAQTVAAATAPRALGDEALLPSEVQALAAAGVDLAQLRCLPRQRWSTTLRGDARLTAGQILDELGRLGVQIPDDKRETARKQVVDTVFWRMVLTQILDGQMHNLGATRLGDLKSADGKPLLLVRSAFTPDPQARDSCVHSLLRAAGVRHMVNLYSGPMPTQALEAAERQAVAAAGGSYYTARDDPHGSWREDLREGEADARKAAMVAVADLIRSQILRPGGAPPKGSVQIHCGGGMHRTGMVFGVFDRCVNGTAWPVVVEGYKRHVGWRSDADPGGFEPANLQFIEQFDCGLLSPRP